MSLLCISLLSEYKLEFGFDSQQDATCQNAGLSEWNPVQVHTYGEE